MEDRESDAALRVCAVSYLNTVPLIWGLQHPQEKPGIELLFALPSQCAELLAAGAVDVGLVPAIELIRQPLRMVANVGIACRGAVRSILVLSRGPIAAIGTLAADTSSRTSVILAQIILKQQYGVQPVMLPHAPELGGMLESADAALVIGDPALRIDPETVPYHCLDLGEEWAKLTGLPMVFAVWAARQGAQRPGLESLFWESWQAGEANLERIAAEEGPRRGIDPALAYRYLTRHIVYPLGEPEREGLNRFLQLAHRLT